MNKLSPSKDYFAGMIDQKRLRCPHCKVNKMRDYFMVRLNQARLYAGIAFVINSGYRCPIYNKAVDGVKSSSHVKGLAVDIKATNWWKVFKIIGGIYKAGFRRIRLYIVINKLGVPKPKHIHVDYDLTKPQDTFSVATYKKKR